MNSDRFVRYIQGVIVRLGEGVIVRFVEGVIVKIRNASSRARSSFPTTPDGTENFSLALSPVSLTNHTLVVTVGHPGLLISHRAMSLDTLQVRYRKARDILH